jgi:hypothetical protein
MVWGSVFAQGNLTGCQGTDVGKWNGCFGILNFANGDRYEGSLDSGKPSGLGSYFYFSNNQYKGTKYVGEFKNGNRHGQGVRYAESGAVLETGEWFNNGLIKFYSFESNRFPFNAQTQPSSVVQPNLAQNNLPACPPSGYFHNCFGTYNLSNGDKYVGEFRQDKFNGQGTYNYSNGDKFVGDFKDGKSLQGTYSNTNGDKYVGGVKGGKRDGYGTYFFLANNQFRGDKYVGEWKNDVENGEGTYTNSEGEKYVGQWKDGNRSGQGIQYSSNNSIIRQGIWADGNFVRSTSEQKPAAPDQEIERLRAEAEEAKRKKAELEQQLRIAQQQSTQKIQTSPFTIQTAIPTERRIALVIGNATYKVNPLKNPVNDSTDMARSLRSVGFDVIEANNTTLAQMREVTRRFADKLGNSDVGLVYYSGHGVEVKGKNYLIPVNADIKREYEVVDQAFDASQFLEMMDNIRGPNNKRVNILIVDACRNNELQKSWRSTNNGLARMDAPGGTFISFATAPGRVAADGVGRNSPYTKHLLQALKQPNVPIEQVFKVVRRNVMEETKGEQIPWENSSLVGDFYFTVQR